MPSGDHGDNQRFTQVVLAHEGLCEPCTDAVGQLPCVVEIVGRQARGCRGRRLLRHRRHRLRDVRLWWKKCHGVLQRLVAGRVAVGWPQTGIPA